MQETLAEEVDIIGSDLPAEARKQITTDFTNTILNGGEFDFGAPDGKLIRASYTRSDDSRTLGIAFDVTEVKTRRNEARRARKSLESTLNGLHHGVLLYDKTGHIEYFNDSFRVMSESNGVKLEKGMFHRDVYDQLPQKVQDLFKINESGELDNFEFIQQAPNGKHYLFESRRLPNKSVLFSKVDVTELQENRAEKKQIQQTLESTLKGLSQGVMLIDETGHIAYCNDSIQSFAKETGTNIEIGLHHSKIRQNVPDQRPEGRTTSNGDFEYVTTSNLGNTFMVRRRVLDKIGTLVSTIDITELTDARAKTKNFSDMMEKTLESLPHGVLLYDQHGKVRMLNSVFENTMSGMGLKISKGMTFDDISAQIPEKFRKELTGAKPGSPFEVIQRGFDDKSYLMEGRDIEGFGFLVSTVDITEHQNALEAAKSADIAKSSFLANMSHEIRTPMNGVLGMAQVLEQTDVTPHQQKCVNIIKSSSEMLLRVINDILDISKLDAQKVELELQPMDLAAAIQSAVEIVKPRLQDKPNVEIICENSENPETWHLGDTGRIRQILINLIGNGIKFTQKGHVRIKTIIEPIDEISDRIKISIEDTGIGVPPEKAEIIFDRFEQSDMSTTRVYGGTGLGLAISRNLVENMGGSLRLCPQKTDGACFMMEITAKRCEPARGQTQPVKRKTFKDIPVLIIDDNNVNHLVLSNQLKPLKVAPFCLSSAKHGLSVLRKMAQKNLPLPLVICDYQMPAQSGYDFVQALRADPLIAQTEVIILTSADITSRRKDFAELEVKYVLEKPCANVELLDAVAESLNRSLFIQKTAADLVPNKLVPNKTEDPKPVNASFRVLVADDDPVNRTVFEGLLNLAGCTDVTLVKNGLEAVQIFSQENFDLVLMDISMPVLNGMKATEKIRNYERREGRGQTPIIAVTAHALKGDKEKFLDVGMNDYLAKPILKQTFEAIIEKWSPYRFEQDSPNALAS